MSRVGALFSVLLVACGAPASPTALTPDDVAGTYDLVALSGVSVGVGPGQVTGTVRLDALGRVERSVTYRSPEGAASVSTLAGSYSLSGGRLELTLLDGTYAWSPTVTLDDRILTITYPAPADGPAVLERYEGR